MIDLSYAAAGALTGFIVGLTSVGSGALMTPILLLVFGVSPVTAIATVLWFAAITKIVGARIHHTSGNVDWQVVKRLWLGSLPVALAIVIFVGTQMAKVTWLTQAIGIAVLITAIGLLLAPWLASIGRVRRIAEPTRFKAMQPGLTVLSGAAIGLCVALTSVGAGALGTMMLMFLYPLRMTPHRIVATDIVYAIPLSIVAGVGYLFAGLVDWAMLASLLLGSIPAVILGGLLAQKFSGRIIQVCLGLILLAMSIKVLI
jgi:uncharacterized membrane protein YfcA